MRVLLTVILGSTACLCADDAGKSTSTPVADALDWYAVWWGMNPSTPGVQKCRGELRANLYRFRCDPLSVVVDAVVDGLGRCSIVSMRPSINSDDGLLVQTLAHLVPFRNSKPASPQGCGELPLKDGAFEPTIAPRARQVNEVLTTSARDAALAYNKEAGDQLCLLRLPNVKAGDPFFHVYEECHTNLDVVWEFAIKDGQVAGFPHWSYVRRRDNLPTGTEWRRNQIELWFGVSRPEERKPARR